MGMFCLGWQAGAVRKMLRMETAIKMCMLFVINFMTIVKEVQKERGIQMRAVNDRLALTEGKLTKTQGELFELKTENVLLKERIKMTEQELRNTKAELQTKAQKLDIDVSFLMDPPFFHACAYQHDTTSTQQTISYSALLYSSTNIEGGNLDLSTGVFTCPYPGSYMVTWGLRAYDDDGDASVQIFLR